MPAATPTVEVGWSGSLGTPTFSNISTDMRSFTCERGRPNDLSSVQQGRAVTILNDSNGKYNPENPSSSLAGSLVPMRPVRIRTAYGGTTYGLHYGFISRIEHSPTDRTSVIESVDLFEWLNSARPTIAAMTNKSPDYIIGQILDAVGWTDPTFRSLQSSSDIVPSFSGDGTVTALTHIENILASDRGLFFIDGDGVAVYLNRSTHYANGTIVATLSSLVGGLSTSVEKDRIINGQTVLRTGGTAQTATDATSRTNYGNRDGASISSAYIETDSQALSLATWVVGVNKNPRSPAREVGLMNTDDTAIAQQLGREIGDQVTVSETQGSTNFNGRIQAISHQVDNGAQSHRTKFTVQKVTVYAFTIGVSTIGGTDVLAY